MQTTAVKMLSMVKRWTKSWLSGGPAVLDSSALTRAAFSRAGAALVGLRFNRMFNYNPQASQEQGGSSAGARKAYEPD